MVSCFGRRAFTLVELLVVIAIIAILAGLLFPVFGQAKRAALTTASMSNAKQLGIGLQLYLESNDDAFPNATDGLPGQNMDGGWVFYSNFQNTDAGTFDVKRGSLYPYVSSAEVFKSRNDGDAAKSGNSYAINGVLAPYNMTGLNAGVGASTVEFPSSMMLLCEEGTGDGSSFLRDPYPNGTNDGYLNPLFDHFARFHNGRKSILIYVDTHAKVTNAEDRFVQVICGSDTVCF